MRTACPLLMLLLATWVLPANLMAQVKTKIFDNGVPARLIPVNEAAVVASITGAQVKTGFDNKNPTGTKGYFSFGLRLPVQYELQKAELRYSFDTLIQEGRQINFGLDALLEYRFKKVLIYTGIGFFRNRFNIQRGYNHQALNPGRDSLPFGTSTDNYNYSLLRFPVGINAYPISLKSIAIGIGLEHVFNFSFRRKYNGGTPPIANPNTVYNGTDYFGRSLQALIPLAYKLRNDKGVVTAEPYLRIYNRYKKDRFLYEDEQEHVERRFDAIGFSLKYSFTF